MEGKNAIGLDINKAKHLAEKLNELLANYSIFYQNTRGYHWNIKGEKFFELHVKFEELYNDLILKIDEVAERILTLGHTPNHNYSDYKTLSKIKESVEVSDGIKVNLRFLFCLKNIFFDIISRFFLRQRHRPNGFPKVICLFIAILLKI